ncbi:MAG: O-antigen ligase family protein [Patescibacteria group bacterium]|nr:O-antigen ligase family protein [Patescibacteria group bacterium]
MTAGTGRCMVDGGEMRRVGVSAAGARTAWPCSLLVAVLLGYLCIGRSFAHLGAPPLYMGEIVLVVFMALCPLAVFRPTVDGLIRRSPLSGVMWCLYWFAACGAVQCIRGLGLGHHAISTLQNTVFQAYAFFIFAGLWLGGQCGDRTKSLVWLFAACHGAYGLVYILVLSPLGLATEDASGPIPWFGQPNHAAAMLIALLAVEARLRRLWFPIAANSFVLLAMQIRAEWLGLVVGLALWGGMTGKVRQLALSTFGAGLLFLVWCATDVTVPVPESRGGGEMGGRELIGRVVASVDPDTAASFTKRADTEHGTVSWRTEWWKAILRMVHRDPATALFGPGYGYPIWNLHPEGLDETIRTPHNAFVYALGYTGWVGLAFFVVFQGSLGAALWKVYRQTGQTVGFCFWAVCLTRATFDNFFEAPHFAIPYFVIIGLFLSPLLTPPEEGRLPHPSTGPGAP